MNSTMIFPTSAFCRLFTSLFISQEIKIRAKKKQNDIYYNEGVICVSQ